MTSEGSNDTEDLSNNAENSAFAFLPLNNILANRQKNNATDVPVANIV